MLGESASLLAIFSAVAATAASVEGSICPRSSIKASMPGKPDAASSSGFAAAWMECDSAGPKAEAEV
jgi:hypothetical protein